MKDLRYGTPFGLRSPKIAVFTSRFPELSQTFVLDQVSALRDAGFDVHVFAKTRSESSIGHPKGRELMALGRYADQHPLVRLLARSPRSERIRESGKSFFFRRLQRRAAEHFDLVLCHFGPIGLSTALHTRETQGRAPIWTIFHGYDLSQFLRQHGDAVYRPLFDIGSRFLPISSLPPQTRP
jgi:colanic acid/amylovoran biosynthesis glycosyltransferase